MTMLYNILFLVELLTLFILSKKLINVLYSFFHKITKSRKTSIYFLCVIFLPGTLIHELSHYLMSVLLFVPAGNMTLIPKIVGDGVKMGSVDIARTDPVRRMLIGMAPFLFGTSLLIGMFFYAAQTKLFGSQLAIIGISYLVFEIGNTMFSSKKDMEGALELTATLVIISILLFAIGARIPAINPRIIFSNIFVLQTFQKMCIYLAAPLSIDTLLIVIFKLLTR